PVQLERQVIDKAPAADSTANTPAADDLTTIAIKDDIKMPEVDATAELDAFVREQKLDGDIIVSNAERDIVITMKEKVSFIPGSAVILKNSTPVLDKVSDLIKRHPSSVVEIDGHTDNSPIHSAAYPSNWELSTARATSVLRYFIGVKGIDPSRFYVKGNADSRPIAPNDTPLHRSQNRRVEIRIKGKSL
ncbi:MAG: OmpA family protein, partial [Nitrospirae bacterium]|nr:OmpA family protein [Nitrospirota bacterium]